MAHSSNIAPRSIKVNMARDSTRVHLSAPEEKMSASCTSEELWILKVIPLNHYIKVIARKMANSSYIAPRSKKVNLARDNPTASLSSPEEKMSASSTSEELWIFKVIPLNHYIMVIVRKMVHSSNIAPRSKKVNMARDSPRAHLSSPEEKMSASCKSEELWMHKVIPFNQ